MKRLFLLYGIALSALTNCGSTLVVLTETNSYGNDANLRSKKYILISGDKNIKENDLQFLEFAQYARFVLKMRGYREVENYSDADMLITCWNL
jgi:hypothetical protein